MNYWETILDWLLGTFRHIGDFAIWLFHPFSFNIQLDNEILNAIFHEVVDWLNGLNFRPVDIFSIGIFTFLIVLGILKLIF